MILIFSTNFDYSTDNVVNHLLYNEQKVLRINKEDKHYNLKYIDDSGIYIDDTINNVTINLKEATSIWWRRSAINSINIIKEANNSIKKFDNYLKQEEKSLKEYIADYLYSSCPVNLGNSKYDLNRLIVFRIAEKMGLIIPKFSIITNNYHLHSDNATYKNVVTKAIDNGIYSQIENQRYYTYTELIEEDFYKKNRNDNTFFPSLVTELIEKKLEIRTFYIDGQFFSMAIFSQSNEQTKVDFRKYANNRIEPYKLPIDIELKLKEVFNKLDLNCGSVDLIVDKNDNYVFLEINPVGQYGMTSEPCNYNLDKIVTNYLIHGRLKIN